MNLAEEYKNQYQWRSWDKAFDLLPDLDGQTVLDLGCAVGDQAADLIKRGARVIGIDINEDLLDEARSRCPQKAQFIRADFRNLSEIPQLNEPVDGLWCSFAVAYLTDFSAVLNSWKRYIKKGGWIALTEIDNFFGHDPLSKNTKAMLDAYVQDAYRKRRYDFNMGKKLEDYLQKSGFTVTDNVALADREFSFSGPAPKEVLAAWQKRFDRMSLLHEFCGDRYTAIRDEFLSCLANKNHRSSCKVICCVGRW